MLSSLLFLRVPDFGIVGVIRKVVAVSLALTCPMKSSSSPCRIPQAASILLLTSLDSSFHGKAQISSNPARSLETGDDFFA